MATYVNPLYSFWLMSFTNWILTLRAIYTEEFIFVFKQIVYSMDNLDYVGFPRIELLNKYQTCILYKLRQGKKKKMKKKIRLQNE